MINKDIWYLMYILQEIIRIPYKIIKKVLTTIFKGVIIILDLVMILILVILIFNNLGAK